MERVTERIGQERVDQRHGQVQAFLDLPLMEKFAAPVAHAPDLAVVSMDGGRLQIRDRPPGEAAEGDGAGVAAPATPSTAPAGATEPASEAPAPEVRAGHWREDKIGLLMTMTERRYPPPIPAPEIPEAFIDPTRILKLARELKSRACAATEDAVAEPPETASAEEAGSDSEHGDTAPKPLVQTMVATRQAPGTVIRDDFGRQQPWRGVRGGQTEGVRGRRRGESTGRSRRDGSVTIVAILDFIHALSYVFAAAMAGRPFR